VRPFLTLFALMTLVLPASSAEMSAVGLWLREDGTSQVRISPCGPALCGFVAWVQDAQHASDIGTKVFYDMKPAGPGKWDGAAFNPEDGKTYTGKMLLEGTELKTSGCVFGGLICKSVNWTRLK
jgi:uncharacterized protein (DUF2147 family)